MLNELLVIFLGRGRLVELSRDPSSKRVVLQGGGRGAVTDLFK
jgi:hypothetical protein